MDDVVAARALHVLFVVIWIGGVSMATTVVLPAVRRGDLALFGAFGELAIGLIYFCLRYIIADRSARC